jgi:hypothetical protein
MGNTKVFLDHLVFSLVSVFVAILVFSLIVGGIAPDFSLGDHIWSVAAIWAVLSISLASLLTYSSIKKRPNEHIDFTRRKY